MRLLLRMGGLEVGGEGDIIYLSLHCHHQNDFCIKVGSDESHFNVLLTVMNKVLRQCPQTTTFEEKTEGDWIRGPFAYQPKRLLGQTGSQNYSRPTESLVLNGG